MNKNEWQKINGIISDALDLPSSQRAAHVAKACENNAALRLEVEELLAADTGAGVLEAESVFALATFSDDVNKISYVESRPNLRRTLIGEVLDNRYEITELIGEGGMGFVFMAKDRRLTNRVVVVKFLKPEILQEEYLIKKFRQEMEALARIKADDVVDIYDTGTFRDLPYLVTEYFAGKSLDVFLSEKPVSVPFAGEIVRKIGRALNAVHRAGIIHRDLKPSNILINDSSGEIEVRIIDFGIARVHDSVVSAQTTQLGRTLGTAFYMSPEQLYGEQNLSPASDVFSLGVIAYEMLTGKRPFAPQTIAQLPELHRLGVKMPPRELRPEISEAAEKVMLKALHFTASERFQNAADFGIELAEALKQTMPKSAFDAPTNAPTEVILTVPPPAARTTNGGEEQKLPDNNRPPTPTRENAGVKPRRTALIFGASLTAILVLSAVSWLVYTLANSRNNLPPAAPNNSTQSVVPNNIPLRNAAEREFAYSIKVQPSEKNRPAFTASPLQTFLGGWRFRLQFQSPQNGRLYLLSEGLNEKGEAVLSILFPDPRLNKGEATVEGNQKIETNQYEFAKTPGVEKFWIVWSASAVPALEAVKSYVNPNDLGMIADETKLQAVREFLRANEASKPAITEDAEKTRVVVKGIGEVVVYPAEFRHN